MEKPTGQFVPLTSLRTPERPPSEVLAEIRRLYFKTSKGTVEADLVHAIALLKELPTEEARDKAAVYMEGLTEMRSEWAKAGKRGSSDTPSGRRAKRR